MPDGIIPHQGFTYAPRSYLPDTADETRLHDLCGIDESVFGGALDPAYFITHAINEGVRNGISASGGVNMVQTLRMLAPLRGDQPVSISGEILSVVDVPRGRVTESITRYAGPDGTPGLENQRAALKTDPTRTADPALRGAGDRPPPVVADVAALRVIGTHQLTPDETCGYCRDTPNPIHLDMEAANRAGYRAPIIGGSHGVRFLTAAIWAQYAPATLTLDIYFRRPLFWDDAFDIRVADGADGWTAMCLSKAGKVAVEARITNLTPN